MRSLKFLMRSYLNLSKGDCLRVARLTWNFGYERSGGNEAQGVESLLQKAFVQRCSSFPCTRDPLARSKLERDS